jgi:hypothetical protein
MVWLGPYMVVSAVLNGALQEAEHAVRRTADTC